MCEGLSLTDNIVLVGMPGAGKSTVGVLLARALGMAFVDTDLELQKARGKLLQEIIDNDGIEGFLKAEEETVLSINCSHAVVATGGSVVYSSRAMMHLKKNGLVVYLKADLEAIRNRINNMATRGIAMAGDRTLADIYYERIPLYEKYADIIIDCSGKDPEGVVGNIIECLRQNR